MNRMPWDTIRLRVSPKLPGLGKARLIIDVSANEKNIYILKKGKLKKKKKKIEFEKLRFSLGYCRATPIWENSGSDVSRLGLASFRDGLNLKT